MRQIRTWIYVVAFVALLGVAIPAVSVAAEGESVPAPAPDKAAKPEGEDAKNKPALGEGGAEEVPAGEGADAKKKKNTDVTGGRFAGDPIYVHISPMVLPIITESGVEQLVTVIIDVEVKDIDTADTMHSNMPRVKDALMRALYGGLGQGTLRTGKLVNINKLKTRATTALTDVIGDGVREVLIQSVSQRML